MLTQLRADTPLPLLWLAMLVTGHRRRADVRGVPADRPEQRAGPPDRLRGQQPVVLPADRRHGWPRDHGHGVRDVADARDAVRARCRRGCRRRSVARSPRAAAGAQASPASATWGRRSSPRCRPRRRPSWQPFIPAIVGAIHQAFSIATASTFAIGIATCARGGRPRAAVPRGARGGRQAAGRPRPSGQRRRGQRPGARRRLTADARSATGAGCPTGCPAPPIRPRRPAAADRRREHHTAKLGPNPGVARRARSRDGDQGVRRRS